MSTDATDVTALLPNDHRVGEVQVIDVDVVDDVDSQGDDAVRILLTLAPPTGDTWSVADVRGLQARIRQGLVRAGEDRSVVFSMRSPMTDAGEPEAVEDPALRTGPAS